MALLAKPDSWARTDGARERLFARTEPVLRPHMLWRRREQPQLPFPFNDPTVRYVHLARNGVHALVRHLGLEGQEVLFPSYFCGVELDALLAAGARPRFFPVSAQLVVDPDAVGDRITSRTRAIYLIHYFGFPGPVAELRQTCRERGLLLIEDCALALLSRLGEDPLGSFGDGAVFCLYKSLPTPDGGAVVTRGAALRLAEGARPSLSSAAAKVVSSLLLTLEIRGSTVAGWSARRVRLVGEGVWRAAGKELPGIGRSRFDSAELALAMSRLSSVILRSQDFSEIVERRRQNYASLLERLREVAPPIFNKLPAGVCPLFYPLQVHDRTAVMARMRERGVEPLAFWSRHHAMAPRGTFPEVDRLRETLIGLPCHQDLDLEAVERLATVVSEAVERV